MGPLHAGDVLMDGSEPDSSKPVVLVVVDHAASHASWVIGCVLLRLQMGNVRAASGASD